MAKETTYISERLYTYLQLHILLILIIFIT